MLLNKKQKRFLFTEILNDEDKIKLFETTDLNWLLSLKIKIKKGTLGWKSLVVDNEEITQLNFFKYGEEWNEVLNNIDDYEQCEWCKEWFKIDEMVNRSRGFKHLCHHCNDYLKSREG